MSIKINTTQIPSNNPNMSIAYDIGSMIEIEVEPENIPMELLKNSSPEFTNDAEMKTKTPLNKVFTDKNDYYEEVEKDELIQLVGYQNFTQNEGFFRRIFFFNYIIFINHIRKIVFNMKKKLSIINLPLLSENEQLDKYLKVAITNLDKLKKSKTKLNKSNLLFSVFSIFSFDFLICVLQNLVSMSMNAFYSIFLGFIISAVAHNDKELAFKWAGLLVGCMFFRAFIQQNSMMSVTNLSTKLRLVIIGLLYKKLGNLSYYSIQRANMGKIINIISGDMNAIEMKMLVLIMIICIPVVFFYVWGVLIYRFGIISASICLSPSFLIFTLLIILQKSNENIYRLRNGFTDERIKVTNEVIEGVRLIKMYGWEKSFKESVDMIRESEIKKIIRINNSNFMDRTINFSATYVLSFVLFITYYNFGNELDPGMVFASLQILDFFKTYICMFFGIGFQMYFEIRVILQRIIDILEIQEQEALISNEKPLDSDNLIELDNFTCFWNEEELKRNNPVINSLTFNFKKGNIYAVIGKVGGGKSSLLYSLLREIPLVKGKSLFSEMKIAYVEQEPFAFAGTIRSNILFGRPFKKDFYKNVLYSCSLHKDLVQFAQGDLTEIGEKGVTLSGGQRARLALARALYSEADLYLLDDPLSAIDAKVVRHVFNNAIKGILKDKTVILVTHQIQFIKDVDQILLIEDGILKKSGGIDLFKQDLNEYLKHNDDKSEIINELEIDNEIKIEDDFQNRKVLSIIKESRLESENSIKKDKKTFVNRKSIDSKYYNEFFESKIQLYKDESEEKIEKTSVLIVKYFRKIRSPALIFIAFILYLIAELIRFGIVRVYGLFSTSDIEYNTIFLYAGLLIVGFYIFNFSKLILTSYLILKGNQNIHKSMFHSLIRTTIDFFDTNPSGRIVNRFSNDINIMDNVMNMTLNDLLDLIFYFISMVVTIFVVNPWFIIPMFALILIYYVVFNFFFKAISDSKKLDLANKSPIFSFFSSTISGFLCIKTYNKYDYFFKKYMFLLHNYARTNYIHYTLTRTFAFYVEFIASLFAGIGIFIFIANVEDSSLFGQSVIYLLFLAETLQWFLRQIITVITIFNSVDRAINFTNLSSEGDLVKKSDQVLIPNRDIVKEDEWDYDQNKKVFNKKNKNKEEKFVMVQAMWPIHGSIKFNNVLMRYRENTPLVLKSLSFEIKPGEKVGCVGRTGAGKSSITQVLFRLTDIEDKPDSSISIDDLDIRRMGLHTLRHNISIIPQIPFVFVGNIRRNLDPLNHYNDDELWKVLEDVDLKKYVMSLEKGLLTDMTQSSSVFSVGQKQLICLARAILRNNKILILDEATSNVDLETDKFIQEKIKEKFKNCTVLTIAHRLLTIADYDKVLVLEKGINIEYDSPFNLLAESENDENITKNGFFADLVKNTGKDVSQKIFQMAKNKYLSKNINFN